MHLKPYPKFQKELKFELNADGMCDDADGQLDIWAVIKPGNTKKKIGIFTGQQCGQSSAPANLSTEGIRADVGPANPRMVSMKAKGCWEVEGSTAARRKRSAEPDKRFSTMHLKPYPKFQKEVKLESNADGMCDDADGQLDIWTVIKPGNTKKKIGIFTGQQCGQSSAPANLSTEGFRADVGPANPRMVSMKAKGCWVVEGSTATRRKRSAEPDKRFSTMHLKPYPKFQKELKLESNADGMCDDADGQLDIWTVINPGNTKEKIGIFTGQQCGQSSAPANLSTEGIRADVGPANPRMVSMKAKGCWEVEGSTATRRKRSAEPDKRFSTMHLKPYPKFLEELKLESNADGMCVDADGQMDIWAIIKPGNTKEKIGIFTGQQCGQSSTPANLSTEGIRADVGLANPRTVSMKAKGCWEVEGSTATRRKRSTEPDKRCCPERLSQGGRGAQLEARKGQGEGKTLSVVEIVAYIEQRANKPQVDCTKPLHPRSSGPATTSRVGSLNPALCLEERPERLEALKGREEEGERMRVLDMVAKLELECLKRQSERECSSGGGLSRNDSLRGSVCRMLLPGPGSEVSSGPAPPQPEPIDRESRAVEQYHESTPSPSAESRGAYRGETEGEGEGKTLSVVEMVTYMEQRANKPQVACTKTLHPRTSGSATTPRVGSLHPALCPEERLERPEALEGREQEGESVGILDMVVNIELECLKRQSERECSGGGLSRNNSLQRSVCRVLLARPGSEVGSGSATPQPEPIARESRAVEQCHESTLPPSAESRDTYREETEGEGERKTLSLEEMVAYLEERANKPQVDCTKTLHPRASGSATTPRVGTLHPALCLEERLERPEALEGRKEEGQSMCVLDIVANLESKCLKRQSERECSSSGSLLCNSTLQRSVCQVLIAGPGSEVNSGSAPPQPEPMAREIRAVEMYHESTPPPSAESRGAHQEETEASESATKPCIQVDAKEQDEEVSRGGSSHAEHREEPLPGMQFFFSQQEQQPDSTASQDSHPAAPRYDREDDPGSKDGVEEREEEVVLELDVLPRPAQEKKQKRNSGAHQEKTEGSESAAKPCMQVDAKEQEEEVSKGGSSHAEHREEPLPGMQFFFSQQEQQPASTASQDSHPAAPRYDSEEDPGSKEGVEEREEEVVLELDVLPRPAQKKKKKRKRGVHQEETEGSESATKPCIQVDAKEEDEEVSRGGNSHAEHREEPLPGMQFFSSLQEQQPASKTSQDGHPAAPRYDREEDPRSKEDVEEREEEVVLELDVLPRPAQEKKQKRKSGAHQEETEGSESAAKPCMQVDAKEQDEELSRGPLPGMQFFFSQQEQQPASMDSQDGHPAAPRYDREEDPRSKEDMEEREEEVVLELDVLPRPTQKKKKKRKRGAHQEETEDSESAAKPCMQVDATEQDEELSRGGSSLAEHREEPLPGMQFFFSQQEQQPASTASQDSHPAAPRYDSEEDPGSKEGVEEREEEVVLELDVLPRPAQKKKKKRKRGVHQEETEGSESATKPCIQVDAKEQDEEVSRGGSSHAEHREEPLPGIQFFSSLQEQQPASKTSQDGHYAAPRYDREDDPRSKEDVEEREEEVVLELDVLPWPAQEKKQKRKSGAHQEETEGSESAAKPCMQVDAKEQDEELSRGGSSHAEHREEPLPGMQFFFSQQEQQPASTDSQDGHPAAPRYDREEDPKSKEDMEEREEEVVLELDVLPRPATEGSESATKPCIQVDAKEQDKEVSRGGSSHAEHREEPLPGMQFSSLQEQQPASKTSQVSRGGSSLAEHREEPLPGMQFFFSQQEQQPASTASQDSHPAAPRYDSEEDPGSKEGVEEREEEVVLELDVLPRPATEGSESATKPCIQVDAKEQDEEVSRGGSSHAEHREEPLPGMQFLSSLQEQQPASKTSQVSRGGSSLAEHREEPLPEIQFFFSQQEQQPASTSSQDSHPAAPRYDSEEDPGSKEGVEVREEEVVLELDVLPRPAQKKKKKRKRGVHQEETEGSESATKPCMQVDSKEQDEEVSRGGSSHAEHREEPLPGMQFFSSLQEQQPASKTSQDGHPAAPRYDREEDPRSKEDVEQREEEVVLELDVLPRPAQEKKQKRKSGAHQEETEGSESAAKPCMQVDAKEQDEELSRGPLPGMQFFFSQQEQQPASTDSQDGHPAAPRYDREEDPRSKEDMEEREEEVVLELDVLPRPTQKKKKKRKRGAHQEETEGSESAAKPCMQVDATEQDEEVSRGGSSLAEHREEPLPGMQFFFSQQEQQPASTASQDSHPAAPRYDIEEDPGSKEDVEEREEEVVLELDVLPRPAQKKKKKRKRGVHQEETEGSESATKPCIQVYAKEQDEEVSRGGSSHAEYREEPLPGMQFFSSLQEQQPASKTSQDGHPAAPRYDREEDPRSKEEVEEREEEVVLELDVLPRPAQEKKQKRKSGAHQEETEGSESAAKPCMQVEAKEQGEELSRGPLPGMQFFFSQQVQQPASTDSQDGHLAAPRYDREEDPGSKEDMEEREEEVVLELDVLPRPTQKKKKKRKRGAHQEETKGSESAAKPCMQVDATEQDEEVSRGGSSLAEHREEPLPGMQFFFSQQEQQPASTASQDSHPAAPQYDSEEDPGSKEGVEEREEEVVLELDVLPRPAQKKKKKRKRGVHQEETEGSESATKPCIQVDAKEQDEEVSRGGSSHAEHREEPLPRMQFFSSLQEQQPASKTSQDGHPAAPRYDREEDPRSKEDVEEREEKVVLELDVLPRPAQEKKQKRKSGAHQEETEGSESAAQPCMQVAAKEQDEELSRGPLPGMQFFFSQQEQQPASTDSQDGHPAAPRYDREEDPRSKEDMEEREEEVVLELDVLPRPTQKKKKKRKRGAHQEETEGSESAAKPCMQVDATEQDEEVSRGGSSLAEHREEPLPGMQFFFSQQEQQPASTASQDSHPAVPRYDIEEDPGSKEDVEEREEEVVLELDVLPRPAQKKKKKRKRGVHQEETEGSESATKPCIQVYAKEQDEEVSRGGSSHAEYREEPLPGMQFFSSLQEQQPASKTSQDGHPATPRYDREEDPRSKEEVEEREEEVVLELDVLPRPAQEKKQKRKSGAHQEETEGSESAAKPCMQVDAKEQGEELSRGPLPGMQFFFSQQVQQPASTDSQDGHLAAPRYDREEDPGSKEDMEEREEEVVLELDVLPRPTQKKKKKRKRGAHQEETKGSESAAKPCMQVDATEQDEEVSRGGSSLAEHREEPLPGMQFFFSQQEQQPASTASQDSHPAAPRYDSEEDPGSKEGVEEREEEVVLELDVLPRPAQKKKKKRKRGVHQEETEGSESATKPCIQVDAKEQDEEVSRGGSSHAEHREEPLPGMQFFSSLQEQQPASKTSQDGHPAAPRYDREEDPRSKEDVEEREEEVVLELDVLPRPAQEKKQKRKSGAHQEETEGSQSAAKPCMQVDAKEQDEELSRGPLPGMQFLFSQQEQQPASTDSQDGHPAAPWYDRKEDPRSKEDVVEREEEVVLELDVLPRPAQEKKQKRKSGAHQEETEGSESAAKPCMQVDAKEQDEELSRGGSSHAEHREEPLPGMQFSFSQQEQQPASTDSQDGHPAAPRYDREEDPRSKEDMEEREEEVVLELDVLPRPATEGSESATEPCIQVDAKEQDEEVSRGGSSHAEHREEPLPGMQFFSSLQEQQPASKTSQVSRGGSSLADHREEPLPGMQFFFSQQEQPPASTVSQDSHPAAPRYDSEEDPGSKEGVEEREEEVVLELDVLPRPATEGSESATKPCIQVDAKEQDEEESRGGSSHAEHREEPLPGMQFFSSLQEQQPASKTSQVSRGGSSLAEHREEPLPGMQFFFSQQEQQPASTASQDSHPAAPRYDSEEDPGSKERVEEPEEEVVLELDVLPRPAQKKKKKRKRGVHQEETEGSESATKPCIQVDAKEQDEEVSRGGSSHAEHREEPLPGMQFFFSQQEQQPASTASQDSHPAAPQYDSEEDPGSKEGVEEREEEVVLELDVLPRPAQKKKKKRKRGVHQEETEGSESATKPCIQVDAKEQDEEVSRGGSSHAEHREEPLPGMQFFSSLQEQQPASKTSQDGHPAAPRYDREEDPRSKEDVEEREEKVVLELDVLPRPAQEKKQKRKSGAHQEETEGSESAAKPCMQVDAKEQDEELSRGPLPGMQFFFSQQEQQPASTDSQDGHPAAPRYDREEDPRSKEDMEEREEEVVLELDVLPRPTQKKKKKRKRGAHQEETEGSESAAKPCMQVDATEQDEEVSRGGSSLAEHREEPLPGMQFFFSQQEQQPASTASQDSHPAAPRYDIEEDPGSKEDVEEREEEVVLELDVLPRPAQKKKKKRKRGVHQEETEGSESATKPCIQVYAKEQDEEVSRGGSSHAEYREEPLPGMQFFSSLQEQQPASKTSQDGHPAAPRYDREEDPRSKEEVEEREEEVVLELDVLPRPAQEKKQKRKSGAHQEETEGSESAAKPCMQVDAKEQGEELSRGPLPGMQFFFSQQVQQPASTDSQDGHLTAPRYDREEDPGSKEDMEEREEEVVLELDVLPRPTQKKKKKRKRGAHQEETKGSESAAKTCMQVDATEQDEEVSRGGSSLAEHREEPLPGMQFFFSQQEQQPASTASQDSHPAAPRYDSEEDPGSKEGVEEREEEVVLELDVLPRPAQKKKKKRKRGVHQEETEGSESATKPCIQVDAKEQDEEVSRGGSSHAEHREEPLPGMQFFSSLQEQQPASKTSQDGHPAAPRYDREEDPRSKEDVEEREEEVVLELDVLPRPAQEKKQKRKSGAHQEETEGSQSAAKPCMQVDAKEQDEELSRGPLPGMQFFFSQQEQQPASTDSQDGHPAAPRYDREEDPRSKEDVVEREEEVVLELDVLPRPAQEKKQKRKSGAHQEETEGSESAAKPCMQVDAKEQDEELSRGGSSHAEHREEPLPGMQFSFSQQEQQPASTDSQDGHPAAPRYDREEDPRSKEDMEEREEEVVLELDVLPRPATEGSESATEPCIQVDAKEQDEEVSRGGSSHAEHREEPLPGMQFFSSLQEQQPASKTSQVSRGGSSLADHREEPLPGMQFFFSQQEQPPASTVSQDSHPAAPRYDSEEDPGSKEGVEEREEEVVLELDVLPRPATEGSESATKPCIQVDAKEQDEEESRGGSSHAEHREEPLPGMQFFSSLQEQQPASKTSQVSRGGSSLAEHREEPLPGMQFFFSQQEQQPASTASQDSHPAAPRYDSEEDPGSKERVEEREEEVVLELDVLPRPAQKKKKKRKRGVHQEETEGSESATKPCIQVDAKEQDEEVSRGGSSHAEHREEPLPGMQFFSSLQEQQPASKTSQDVHPAAPRYDREEDPRSKEDVEEREEEVVLELDVLPRPAQEKKQKRKSGAHQEETEGSESAAKPCMQVDAKEQDEELSRGGSSHAEHREEPLPGMQFFFSQQEQQPASTDSQDGHPAPPRYDREEDPRSKEDMEEREEEVVLELDVLPRTAQKKKKKRKRGAHQEETEGSESAAKPCMQVDATEQDEEVSRGGSFLAEHREEPLPGMQFFFSQQEQQPASTASQDSHPAAPRHDREEDPGSKEGVEEREEEVVLELDVLPRPAQKKKQKRKRGVHQEETEGSEFATKPCIQVDAKEQDEEVSRGGSSHAEHREEPLPGMQFFSSLQEQQPASKTSQDGHPAAPRYDRGEDPRSKEDVEEREEEVVLELDVLPRPAQEKKQKRKSGAHQEETEGSESAAKPCMQVDAKEQHEELSRGGSSHAEHREEPLPGMQFFFSQQEQLPASTASQDGHPAAPRYDREEDPGSKEDVEEREEEVVLELDVLPRPAQKKKKKRKKSLF